MVWVGAMRRPPAMMISLSIFMETYVLILALDEGVSRVRFGVSVKPPIA